MLPAVELLTRLSEKLSTLFGVVAPDNRLELLILFEGVTVRPGLTVLDAPTVGNRLLVLTLSIPLSVW